MKKFKKKIGLLFFIVVAVLYVIIYVVPELTGLFTTTYVAEYGELQTVDYTDMYFVRDETVYTSSVSGQANRLIEEGRLIRGGTAVLEITGGTSSDFTVTEGGVVSYFADGYEGELNSETMWYKDYEYFSSLSQESMKELSTGSVSAGDPVYKIIDKSKWYGVAFISEESIDRYQVGNTVDVELGESTISMTVTDVSEDGELYRLIFETTAYYKTYGGLRKMTVSIITADAAGLIIENSSLVEVDGVQGVYVKNKKDYYVFTPVNVLLTDGSRSVVSDSYFYDGNGVRTDTVGPYDDVLKDPDTID